MTSRVIDGTPAESALVQPRALDADRIGRDRIATELDESFLVEAGAGAGKTAELVTRMVELVRSGRRIDQIAAVTFTRKAAGQLSQRFRIRLEEALRQASASSRTAAHLDAAVRSVDRAFVGTIHAFCARLLREHPLEAGVDPRFTELGEAEAARLVEEYWAWYLDDRHAAADERLERLHDVGVRAAELERAFKDRLEQSDVVFPAGPCPAPDFTAEKDKLVQLLEHGGRLLAEKPQNLPVDSLQKTVRRLRFLLKSNGWRTVRDFCAALETLSKSGCETRQWMWSEDDETKKQVGKLGKELGAYVEDWAKPLLERWYAHRYPVVMEFLEPLLDDFGLYRRRTGQLTFQDLLQFTAELLRNHPDVRRRLGERYRYLLVDEFQDTDPLQAEICLLLASDPDEGDDWREVRPRPGALFLVGDPKQSIYRFRRADMVVYDLVYRRMQEVGSVVALTRNFRSGAAIGRFVDAVFETIFQQGRPTPEQAAFAPMNTREDAPVGRVWRYALPPSDEGDSQEEVAARDARFIASWIARRIREGRKAQDFLVIPYLKVAVGFYARELEKRGIPVTTTGAGLTVERELRELLVLLRALADPQDRVQTVAALEGLFFGLHPGDLWEHHASGGSFSFERATFGSDSPVERALQTLAGWAQLCEQLPVDAALERIVAEIGLLPLAAADEMGESRTGSLLHALELVSATALRGAADLRSAIEVIETASRSAEIEAPLRPGRGDAVRVMNLHKAKGLEAPIVVLAHPTGPKPQQPRKHIRRTDTGEAEGYLVLMRSSDRPLARPLGWERWEAAERRFLEAELGRLLYVATTRAKEELVVGDCEKTRERSLWRGLEAELLKQAETIEVFVEEPQPGQTMGQTVESIRAEVQQLAVRRDAAAIPAFSSVTVTGSAVEEEIEFRGAEGRGREWGEIVHRAIAAMGRGRRGDSLRAYCRALLRNAGRPLDDAGEPVEREELVQLLAGVRDSAAWRELMESGTVRWEVAVTHVDLEEDAMPMLRTGAIDALGVAREGQPSRIVDWKTDVAEGEEWNKRARAYSGQVATYAEILRALRGLESKATIERVR